MLNMVSADWPRKVCLAVTVLLISAQPVGSAEVPKSIGLLLDKREIYGEALAVPIAECVSRRDTHHPLFAGCVDWHSSVHANWALFSLSRAMPDVEVSDDVRLVFENSLMSREMRHLGSHSNFEMPYGRAWFLRLAIEHMKEGSSSAVKPHADPILISLMSYLKAHGIDLYSSNYNSSTWAVSNALDYAAAAGLTTERKELVKQVTQQTDLWNVQCSYDSELGHFMAICTNIALLASRMLTAGEFRRWAEHYLEEIGLPTPVTNPRNCHHFGLNFSRAWGLWELYSATGRLAFADSYSAHIFETMKDPANWRGSYTCVGHWVGQFGVFALQPLFGTEAGR